MKRLLFISIFAIMAMCATASAQEPVYCIDGVLCTLDIVKQRANEIESIMVVNDRETLSNYEKLWKMNDNALTSVICITTKANEVQEEEWLVVDEMPKFMGGDLNTFRMWVMQNVRYPEEAVSKRLEGHVIVSFCVGKDGYIDENKILVLSSPDKLLSDEVERVLKSSPQWTPGRQKGELAIVKFTLPVNFKVVNSTNMTFDDDNMTSDDDQSVNGVERIEVVSFGK
ncbi:MAG: energy transducer TonB [Alistipes sp.]|nr:energy transducer TonB [Alistipes sp.]